MWERYGDVVTTAFRKEKKAIERLKGSFEDFLNTDARAVLCLAIYVDELLQTGLKEKAEAEVMDELQKVVIDFHYLLNKDVFKAYYKQHLAKRLLAAKSILEGVAAGDRGVNSLLLEGIEDAVDESLFELHVDDHHAEVGEDLLHGLHDHAPVGLAFILEVVNGGVKGVLFRIVKKKKIELIHRNSMEERKLRKQNQIDQLQHKLNTESYKRMISRFQQVFDSNLSEFMTQLISDNDGRYHTHLSNLCIRLDFNGFVTKSMKLDN